MRAQETEHFPNSIPRNSLSAQKGKRSNAYDFAWISLFLFDSLLLVFENLTIFILYSILPAEFGSDVYTGIVVGDGMITQVKLA